MSSSSSSSSRVVHAAFAVILMLLLIPSCLILIPLLLDNSNTNIFYYIFTLVNNPFSSSSSSYNLTSLGVGVGWNNNNNNNNNAFGDEGNTTTIVPPPPLSSSRALSPDVSRCGPVGLPNHAITSSNCCPPSSAARSSITNFTDFASSSSPLRVRRPAHLVDQELIAKLERGIALMKALPADDPRNFIQQAKVHCAYCNGGYPQRHPFQHLKIDIHRSWLFFPFHRWYIYFFERILAHLIGDPAFALPFWNWDSAHHAGMQMPSYFADNPSSPLFHQLRHRNHTPPHLVDLYYGRADDEHVPPEQQVSYNLAIMYKQMVLADTRELFMGSPYRLGDKAQPGIGTVELAPHNTLHTWTGAAHTPNHEDMGTFYTAARDPLFYPHHSNLDRMWHLWSTVLDGGARRGYEDDPDWLDSEFFFYDENANLVGVKVRDCLDTKKLGYAYEEAELPWLSGPPPKPRRTRAQREAAAKKVGDNKHKFPLRLDSQVSLTVKRPRARASSGQERNEVEVLVVEIVDLQSDKNVKFDVHINDDTAELSGPDKTEFVGTFVSVPHGHGRRINTRYMVGISKVLQDLEAAQDDHLLLTLVPKLGLGMLRIASITITFMPK